MGLGLEGQGGLPLYQRGAEVWGSALIGAQRLGGACSAAIPQCPASLAEGRLGQGQEGAAVLPTARPPSREKDTASHALLLEGKLKPRRHGVLFVTSKSPHTLATRGMGREVSAQEGP